MALETGTYISDLVTSNPTASDPVSQADDHIRLLKSALQNTFPNANGAISATPTEVNRLVGSSSLVINRAYGEYTTNADITSTIPGDNTIPQNTEGTQIISVSLTPHSTTTRLRLRFHGTVIAGSTINIAGAIFSSASANALVADFVSTPASSEAVPLVIEHEYVPATTSALTFTVRVGSFTGATFRMNGATTARIFGGVMKSTLVVEEIQ